jgi:hypothetical protein
MWQVLCTDTGWRSPPVPERQDAERKARAIDAEIAMVNGVSGHAHRVVELRADRTASVSVGGRS